MEKILSVIVPSYNVEQFLPHCLDSLLQTEQKEMTEILIIDDGSKDSTGAIADEYAEKYPGVVTAVHKENGGHGSTINVGISKASGKFFKVLDSDDAVDSEAYALFLDKIKTLDCDLIVTPFTRVWTDKTQTKRVEGTENLPMEQLLPFEKEVYRLFVKMHEWTIRTEILKSHNIHLTEKSFYVDMQYIIFPIPWVKTLCILPMPVYQYRLGGEGQSVSIKNMQKNRQQHFNVFQSLIAFYKERTLAGDQSVVLDYIARGIAKMEENQVQIALSLPIGKQAKEELLLSETMVRKECPAAYAANVKRSITWLRRSKYLLYPVAAAVWRIVKR